MKKCICLFALFASIVSAAVQAETLYKVIGADGRVTYTDRPPADGKSTTALQFADAPVSKLPDSVLKYQAELAKGMQDRLAQAKRMDNSGPTTLFSASWCGYCTQAKAYLRTKVISYREVDIDTPSGGRADLEAGGPRGVPRVMAAGQRLSGVS
ncbi:MAG: glutaredoxin family protein, partial [Burkholderiales bacterium]|nr:glutaredoxin family protein [Burkholderiales bacterium]